MKKLSILTAFFTLFLGAQLNAQYSGVLTLVVEHPSVDIVKNQDGSRDLHFLIENMSTEDAEALQTTLNGKPEISNLVVSNNEWNMHVEAGTTRKQLMTYFMQNGFKYINLAGEQKEILHYLSAAKKQ